MTETSCYANGRQPWAVFTQRQRPDACSACCQGMFPWTIPTFRRKAAPGSRSGTPPETKSLTGFQSMREKNTFLRTGAESEIRLDPSVRLSGGEPYGQHQAQTGDSVDQVEPSEPEPQSPTSSLATRSACPVAPISV